MGERRLVLRTRCGVLGQCRRHRASGDIDFLLGKGGEVGSGHAEIPGQHVWRRMAEPVRDREGAELREIAVVEHEKEGAGASLLSAAVFQSRPPIAAPPSIPRRVISTTASSSRNARGSNAGVAHFASGLLRKTLSGLGSRLAHVDGDGTVLADQAVAGWRTRTWEPRANGAPIQNETSWRFPSSRIRTRPSSLPSHLPWWHKTPCRS